MFESLKRMAIQRLMQKMASNALGSAATSAAAEQGAGAVMESIKSKIGSGGLSQVTELFSGGDMESNELFQDAKAKMSEALQANGMSAEEAEAEAASTTPDLIAGMKEKFESKEEADKEFDLGGLASLIPGGVGDLLNKAGGAGDLLNKAKNLF